jgi:hypothetical protein
MRLVLTIFLVIILVPKFPGPMLQYQETPIQEIHDIGTRKGRATTS